VQYDYSDKHIEKLKVHEDQIDSVGPGLVQTRSWVISKIREGKTFITIYKNDDGKWRSGDNVHIIVVNGAYYIRTDGNSTEGDNLGSLPRF